MLLYHLSDSKDEGFNVLSMKIIKVLKDLQDEKQKNKDKLKKLEVDKKVKDLEAFKKKIEEADAKRAKDVEEKLLKLKESGFSLSGAGADAKPQSTTDKVAHADVEALSKGLKEKPLVNILHLDEKTEKKIEQIIENKFTAYREDAPSDDASKKSEEALRKEFYTIITKFDDKSLASEYDQCLSSLAQMNGRRTLVNILSHEHLLPFILKQFLGDKFGERKFVAFLKSTYFEGQVMQMTSGLKVLKKKIKGIIANVFDYLIKNQEDARCRDFLDTFLAYDIIDQATTTIP